MIDFYATRSPVFLAARFDAAAARARGQVVGDGTPVQITIPTPNPWVPLRILSLAKHGLEPVEADVYTLTDRPPVLLGLDPGVRIRVSQPASTALLNDLRSDRDSAWIPDRAWLTLVRVETPAGRLIHDLAIDASGASQPSPVQAGYDPTAALPLAQPVGLHPVQTPGQPQVGGNDAPIVVFGLVAAAAVLFGLAVLLTGRYLMVEAPRRGKG